MNIVHAITFFMMFNISSRVSCCRALLLENAGDTLNGEVVGLVEGRRHLSVYALVVQEHALVQHLEQYSFLRRHIAVFNKYLTVSL